MINWNDWGNYPNNTVRNGQVNMSPQNPNYQPSYFNQPPVDPVANANMAMGIQQPTMYNIGGQPNAQNNVGNIYANTPPPNDLNNPYGFRQAEPQVINYEQPIQQPLQLEATTMAQNGGMGINYPSQTTPQQVTALPQNNTNIQTKAAQLQNTNGQWTPQNTLGAIQTGVGVISSLGNLYAGWKQFKFAKEQYEEKQRLDRANFKNTAKAMNSQYRDQMSGRGSAVMSRQSQATHAQSYKNKKVDETF